jgi:tRNA-splicing ligase RtcB
VHLAEDVCIGTVVATRSVLYPAAVGGDIGCGVASLQYAADATVLDDARTAAVILDDLAPGAVASIVVQQAAALKNPPRSPAELLETLREQGLIRSVARLRELLGTIGE